MATTHKKLKNDEQGVVSLIVAIIIVLMLSLIVLAMSQNARNEQRQALDRQLSDQAFYNAETGVNDVVNYLYKTPTASIKNTDCNTDYLAPITNEIDGPDGVNRYTCVLYDKAPETIELDNLQVNDSTLIPIEGRSLDGERQVDVSELTFSWDDANGSGAVSGCIFSGGNANLPPKLPDNCTVGGLRIDLTRADLGRRDLINTFNINAFLLPNSTNGAGIDMSGKAYPNNQGIIGQANCSGSGARKCRVTIKNIDATKRVLHIRSLYEVTDVTISGKDAGGNTIRFNNAQIMIDSTGRANDVLKRIQVRVAANAQYRNVESALHSAESICKVLSVTKDPTGSVKSEHSDCPIN
jgi:type II secretory pathway pseudopilin PulG